MIRAVIFDVDGTLVTFTFDIAGTRRALIGELISRGYSTSDLTTKASLTVSSRFAAAHALADYVTKSGASPESVQVVPLQKAA